MARGTARWLAKRDLYARTVTIKVRYGDFTTITRSQSEPASRDEDALVRRAVALLDKTEAGRRPIRLLGVSVHNLCDAPVVYRRTAPPAIRGLGSSTGTADGLPCALVETASEHRETAQGTREAERIRGIRRSESCCVDGVFVACDDVYERR